MMKIFLLSVVLMFLTFSCRKDEPIVPSLFDGENRIVLGEWEWMETQYYECTEGWGSTNPENTGDNYSFFLTADPKLLFYKNDEILSEHNVKYYIFEVQTTGYVDELKQVSLEMYYPKNDSIYDFWVDGRLGTSSCSNFPFQNDSCVKRYNLFRKVL